MCGGTCVPKGPPGGTNCLSTNSGPGKNSAPFGPTRGPPQLAWALRGGHRALPGKKGPPAASGGAWVGFIARLPQYGRKSATQGWRWAAVGRECCEMAAAAIACRRVPNAAHPHPQSRSCTCRPASDGRDDCICRRLRRWPIFCVFSEAPPPERHRAQPLQLWHCPAVCRSPASLQSV